MVKYKITISGIHCAGCGNNIEKSVKKVKGVKSINVNVISQKGFVETDKEIDVEELKKAVFEAGYKPLSVEKL